MHSKISRGHDAHFTGRFALASSCFSRAAARATELFAAAAADSLVAPYIRLLQAASLIQQAQIADGLEGLALRLEAHRLQRSSAELFDRRYQAGSIVRRVRCATLVRCLRLSQMPGSCREEEVAFRAEALRHANTTPAQMHILGVLPLLSAGFGYVCVMEVGYDSFQRLVIPIPFDAGEQQPLEMRVLRAIDALVECKRVIPPCVMEERGLSKAVSRQLDDDALCPAFRAQLRTKWGSAPVRAVLAERNLLDLRFMALDAAARAARLADVALHGLKTCGLPSCGKREATVKQFKFCSACKAAVYCCDEHGALDWRAHKPTCRATVAAAHAADEAAV